MKKLLLSGIAALFLATGTAHATGPNSCAVVLKTPDGFLNVRIAPKMGTRIVARLKPGDIIEFYDPHPADVNWMHVMYAPQIDEKNGRKITRGWIGRRFVVPVDCKALDPTED
jgi:hypothetical protein